MTEQFHYQLTGKIIPERVGFSLSNVMGTVSVPEFEIECNFSLSIELSIISLKIITEKEIIDFATIRNVLRDLVRLYTDTFGYLHGYAYEIEITSISGKENKPHHIFGVELKEIEDDFSNRPDKKFDEIAQLMHGGNNNELRLALNDFRLSMQHPIDTGMFCYRAMESLMQRFNSGNNDEAWNEFRDSLNLSKNFLQPLIDNSWPSRHGKPVAITHDQRVDLIKRIQKIIDRFVIYAINGHVQLDKTQYLEL